MELVDTTQMALGKAIGAAQLRHQVLAANVANANTPGYQRRDVSFQSVLASALHSGRDSVSRLTFQPTVEPGGAMRADGNTVDIDQESAEIARNALYVEALLAIKSGRGAAFKAAAGIS